MGGIYGCGIVSVVVRRYIIDNLIRIITFPYSTCLFWQHHPYFFVHFLNVFLFLFMLFCAML